MLLFFLDAGTLCTGRCDFSRWISLQEGLNGLRCCNVYVNILSQWIWIIKVDNKDFISSVLGVCGSGWVFVRDSLWVRHVIVKVLRDGPKLANAHAGYRVHFPLWRSGHFWEVRIRANFKSHCLLHLPHTYKSSDGNHRKRPRRYTRETPMNKLLKKKSRRDKTREVVFSSRSVAALVSS